MLKDLFQYSTWTCKSSGPYEVIIEKIGKIWKIKTLENWGCRLSTGFFILNLSPYKVIIDSFLSKQVIWLKPSMYKNK